MRVIRERIGTSPRTDVAQAQAFYDGTEQSVIDAQNTLDDAELVMTEIVGPHDADVAALREDIPLTSPDPASVDAWVASARGPASLGDRASRSPGAGTAGSFDFARCGDSHRVKMARLVW